MNSQYVCYEQPLNERIRALLRLEFLFAQATNALVGSEEWETRAALQAFFDILNLTGRNELKSELLKELERHSTTLKRLADNPDINASALETILEELKDASSRMHKMESPAIERLRQNDFLNTIRQRSNIPGGTCAFDMPALHHWLQFSTSERTRQLQEWLSPFSPLIDSTLLILRVIRDSASPTSEIARGGFYQKTLNSGQPSQIVRVFVEKSAAVFPRVSGGRHRFSVRFMEQPDPAQRAAQSIRDVPFNLVCCVI